MQTLLENLTGDGQIVLIEHYQMAAQDGQGRFIETGKTIQSGPDPEDKEPLYKHKGHVSLIVMHVKEGTNPYLFRSVTISPNTIKRLYEKIVEIEKQESEEPILD